MALGSSVRRVPFRIARDKEFVCGDPIVREFKSGSQSCIHGKEGSVFCCSYSRNIRSKQLLISGNYISRLD